MGHAILTAILLLLIQYGREGLTLTISSNSTGNVLTGKTIHLDIWYNVKPTTVLWTVNAVTVASWANGGSEVSPKYNGRLQLIGNGSLLISNATKGDAGTYNVSANAIDQSPGMFSFQVRVYDPVLNVTIVQSPQSADEKTVLVNLSCSASGDVELVTWTRDGKTLGYNEPYSLQDGNKTLQIKYPNRTHTGNYTCNVSNPVSWSDESWELNVTYHSPAALSGGAIAGIVIGSVFGALLLICLIVLLVCCIRRRKTALGEKKKIAEPQHKDVLRTVSGNTLSPDDPAYFTMNNIMYRNSSISMGSYIMNYNDDTSEHDSPPKPPSSPPRIKHATQV